MNTPKMTERQQREIDFHRARACEKSAQLLDQPFPWDVLEQTNRRWWNAYWESYTYLRSQDLTAQRVLVVGCGFGEDALRLARLGARVSAFDLSEESLQIAKALATKEQLVIDFAAMPAESMVYPDGVFDLLFCRDILHHVDIPATLHEMFRVAKPGAEILINEIYSHSLTNFIRKSALVDSYLYQRMKSIIYGSQQPYITQDERKLNEHDLAGILTQFPVTIFEKHYNFLVGRIFPTRVISMAKLDRILLMGLRPFGRLLAGRILLCLKK